MIHTQSACVRLCTAAFASMLALGACGRSPGDQITLRASLILGETSDWYHGLKRWSELVDEGSGGRIKVAIFPQAGLASGKQDTELEMVQTGGINVSLESSILLSGIDPAFSVWSLPWLFADYAAVDSILLGSAGRDMLSRLAAKGLIGLGYGHNGFRQITNRLRPVASPGDVRNMKLRVPAISMYLDVLRALGADPSPMNFGEVFVALQQGIMDGQENPLSVIRSARLAEVQQYLTVWNYSYDPIVLCVNKALWDGLPASDQDLLRRTAREALKYQRGLVEASEAEELDELRAQGMEVTFLSPDQVAAFRSATAHIDEQYADRIGREWVRRFRVSSGPQPHAPSGDLSLSDSGS